jgi:hypothetical protein
MQGWRSTAVVVSAVWLAGGCATTLKTAYAPLSAPAYMKTINVPVVVRNVSDRRSMDAYTYYERDMDKGRFDKAITTTVRTALETELKRLGMQVLSRDLSESKPSMFLDCAITDCRAVITEKMFASNVLDISLSLNFRWFDANGGLVEENDRSEKHSRKIGVGTVPVLPFDAGQIQDFGNELINSLLPVAIEKELRLNKYLQGLNPNPLKS